MPARLLLVLLIAVITGCATRPVSQDFSADSWQLLGKISIRTVEGTRVLNIDWLNQGETSAIELTGPLGMSVASIRAAGDDLRVATGKREVRYTDNIALRVENSPDIQLPWRSLSYWVRGKTGPRDASLIPADGLNAGAWSVRILDQDERGPRIVEFVHAFANIKLKVNEWRLPVVRGR